MTFRSNLHTTKSIMYFWVNQGKTYKEERAGSYLWAPTKSKANHSLFHWENMKRLKPLDVVLNYRNGFIVGYCVVRSRYFLESKPDEFNVDVEWRKEGYMVNADYYDLNSPKEILEIYNAVNSLLPEKHGPIHATNKEGILKARANEGYLYELSSTLGSALSEFCEIPDIETNYRSDEERSEDDIPDKTSRRGLVNSRIGQGKFRRRVLNKWRNRCAVTGSKSTEILIASHIVPWSEASNKERYDVHNGLLLSPTYDALFDKHLISFDNNGQIVLSKSVSEHEYSKLGITGDERIEGLSESNVDYLARHIARLKGK